MPDAEQGQRREEKVEGEGEGKKGNENDRKMWRKNEKRNRREEGGRRGRGEKRTGVAAVSYTHLTLPTIYSV